MTNRENYLAAKSGNAQGFVSMKTLYLCDVTEDPTMEQDLDILTYADPSKLTEQYYDDFGVLRNKTSSMPPLSTPITDVTAWREQLKLPDSSKYRDRHFLRKEYLDPVTQNYDDMLIVHPIADGITVKLRYLMGFEAMCEAFFEEPEEMTELIRHIALHYYIERIKTFTTLGVADAVLLKDMTTSWNGYVFGRGIWEQFIKPAYAMIIRYAKDLGLEVFYHEDGKLDDAFIDDLIEMGVDMVMGVREDGGNDMDAVLSRAEGKILVAGGLDWLAPGKERYIWEFDYIRENVRQTCAAWGKYKCFIPFHCLFVRPITGMTINSPVGIIIDEIARINALQQRGENDDN